MNTARTKKGMLRGALCALLSVLLCAGPLSPARAQSPDDGFNPRGNGTLNLNNGLSGAQQVSPPSSTFLASEPPGVSANSPLVAGDTWQALPNNGLNGPVDAIAFNGSDMYVGGSFTASGDGAVTLNHIARFSGGAWSALPNNGLNSVVYALAVNGSDLYVGGYFTASGDGALTLNLLARFSGGAWSALPNNGLLAGEVDALAVNGSDLYVGGSFTESGDGAVTNLNQIAKFSGGAWSALPNNGLRAGEVDALAVNGSDLYVGGAIGQTFDGAVQNLNDIAKFSGGAWSALPHNGLSSAVLALAVSGSDLYVGGEFGQTADGALTLNRMARFSGGAWSALPNNGLNNWVNALTVNGSDLYVGGYFNTSADGAVTNLNRIAKFSGGAWSALPNNGLNNSVRALAVNGSDLYAGGWFNSTADGALTLNHIARLSPAPLPVILVPGIGASRLTDLSTGTEYWLGIGEDHSKLSLYPLDNPSPTIQPTGVVRYVNEVTQSGGKYGYGPLLERLTAPISQGGGGFREYRWNNPQQLTTAGCDTGQYNPDPNLNPNLFVFAYDWRKDNVASAAALKDYIGCVLQFYPPGTKVNLLAHSMGGLVSRRYILDNPTQHNVNALITVNTPFLGAPKVWAILSQGDFVPFMSDATTTHIAGSFIGAGQLAPSQYYYNLVDSLPATDPGRIYPIAEKGRDLNSNGVITETYNYALARQALSDQYGNKVFDLGLANSEFHQQDYQGLQDDWHNDTSGVNYYHIYSVQLGKNTIGGVEATSTASLLNNLTGGFIGSFKPTFNVVMTTGDGTVPMLSETRQGSGINYNAPTAILFPFVAQPGADNTLFEHTGALSNAAIQDKIIELLRLPQGSRPQSPQPSLPSRQPAQAALSSDPGYSVTINGADSVVVSDALGNTTPLSAGALNGPVPGLDRYLEGDRLQLLTFPTSGTYTVTFKTTSEPLAVDLLVGAYDTPTQAIRYKDISLPIGVTARVTLTNGTIGALQYDINGDGTFAATVTPTVAVSGTMAQYTVPPIIIPNVTINGGTATVTLTAQDSGAGMHALYYSLDGTNFQSYTGTFTFDWTQNPTLYAIADDNVANRGVLVYPISKRLYLPLVIR